MKALGENHWSEDMNEYIVSEASFCKVLIELDWRHGLQEDLYECLDLSWPITGKLEFLTFKFDLIHVN